MINKNKNSFSSLVINFIKQNKLSCGIWFVCALLLNLYFLVPSFLTKYIIQDYSQAVINGPWLVTKYILIVVGVLTFHNIFWWWHKYVLAKIIPKFQQYSFNDMTLNLFKKNINFFQTISTSSFVSHANEFNSMFETLMQSELTLIVSALSTIFVLFFNIALLYYVLVILFIVYIILMVSIQIYAIGKTDILIEKDMHVYGIIINNYSDFINNFLYITLSNKQKIEIQSINNLLEKKEKTYFIMERFKIIVDMTAHIVVVSFLGFFIGITIYLKNNNLISLEDVGFIVSSILILTGWIWYWSEKIAKAYLRIKKMNILYANITNSENDNKNSGGLSFENGDINFKQVFFSYNADLSDKKEVLQDISFEIKQRQKVGFVGLSGHGKSTVISLLLKLYTPDKGKIMIGNQDLNDIMTTSLYDNISYVPQAPILFNRTIKENISYGCNVTDEQIDEICKIVDLQSFIETLPEKYDYMIGENGSTLSGGQRQRIAIARALLKNSPIMIFDESTSQLDTITESRIINYIYSLKDKTIIFVAHRLNTITKADTIFVFEHGTIAQSGNHDELMQNKDGLYMRLWREYERRDSFINSN